MDIRYRCGARSAVNTRHGDIAALKVHAIFSVPNDDTTLIGVVGRLSSLLKNAYVASFNLKGPECVVSKIRPVTTALLMIAYMKTHPFQIARALADSYDTKI